MARPSPCPPLGDVDGDGLITEADAFLVGQSLSGQIQLSPAQKAAADVSGDGLVTGRDELRIAQYAAGLDVAFACPTQRPGSNWLPLIAVGAAALALSGGAKGQAAQGGGTIAALGLLAFLLLKGEAQAAPPAPPPGPGPAYDNLQIGMEVSYV